MEKEILHIPSQDLEIYCEKRGSGPLLVIMPDGTNDCELYAHIAELMADEFTVVSFDPRGGSRSMPTKHQKVGPELLADDIAAIIRYMDMGKASLFGCSSGGQGVLMTGVNYPELIKNVIVHEAALMSDVQLPGTGFEFIQTFGEVYGPHIEGVNVNPFFASLYVSVYPPKDFDDATNARISEKPPVLGTVLSGQCRPPQLHQGRTGKNPGLRLYGGVLDTGLASVRQYGDRKTRRFLIHLASLRALSGHHLPRHPGGVHENDDS